MIKKYLNTLLLLLCLSFSNLSFAENLDSYDYLKNDDKIIRGPDIIKSTLEHYPQILAYYESVNYAKGEKLQRQGYFDIKLKQSFSNRSRGYYDGQISDTQISRSNQFLGSEFFGGYRKSTGTFPIYESDNLTNSSGEYYAGVKFSLLRNRTIDDPRLKLFLSQLELEENKLQLESIKNKIAADALKSYWRWVTSGNIYLLYKELYELASKRQEKMEILFKEGDISKIILTENQRNILNRKRKLIEAKRRFENDSLYLSLFLRGNKGLPLQPQESQLAKVDLGLNIDATSDHNLNSDLRFALENRPDIEILRIKTRKERKKIKQAENLYKPKLDVSFKVAKDDGNGSSSRQQSDNIVKAELEIPLQRRIAKGQIEKYNSRLSNFKYQQQLLSEKTKIEIEQLKNSINRSIEIYKNIQKEVELSNILQKSEIIKFKRGRSDFFLINLREQELFSARLALLKIYEKYQNFSIKYNAATFRLIEKSANYKKFKLK